MSAKRFAQRWRPRIIYNRPSNGALRLLLRLTVQWRLDRC
jgi:hypothetical protein